MPGEHQPVDLPDRDESMLAKLSDRLETATDVEPMSPSDFYQQIHRVFHGQESALAHAYRAVDHFQAWRRPMDASEYLQFIDVRIKVLSSLADNLRDEICAALGIKNVLILDTEQAAVAYLSELPPQPRIAAQSILTEYRQQLSTIETELSDVEQLQEQ